MRPLFRFTRWDHGNIHLIQIRFGTIDRRLWSQIDQREKSLFCFMCEHTILFKDIIVTQITTTKKVNEYMSLAK